MTNANAINQIAAIRRSAYETALLAENAWMDELERVYGRDANAARYDNNRNAATPKLAMLRDIKDKACDVWQSACEIKREIKRESDALELDAMRERMEARRAQADAELARGAREHAAWYDTSAELS